MRILVLNPPFMKKFSRSSRSPAVAKGGTIYYPLWLSHTTGVLEKAGFEVRLVDAPAKGMTRQDLLELVREFKPKLVVVDTSTASIYNDVKVLDSIKEECDCFAILVGTHVSATAEESIKISEKIDAIARHEYDYTVLELAQKLKDSDNLKIDLRGVKGITFRDENGKIVSNPDREFIENLDELPFVSEVYKRHLDIKDYFYSANLYPEVTIVTGRGCPYRCSFCVWPQVMNGHKHRLRSVGNVVAELKYIKENFPEAKEIFMEDDTLTTNRERTQELCRRIIDGKLKITWSCNSRADVDLETLKMMKRAGCRLLCVGFESGVQEILNNIHKGTTIEKIGQFMKDTKKAGILVHGCFMLGNQGETKETILKTIEFAKELGPDTVQFFPIMVYPGTETYNWAKEKGYLVSNEYSKWVDENGLHNCMLSRPGLTNNELVAMCDLGRRKFYMRPIYVLSKVVQGITHPKELPRIIKASRTFFKHLLRKSECNTCKGA